MKNTQARFLLECWCLRHGYVKNRHGKFEKTIQRAKFIGGQAALVYDTVHRYAFTSISMRKEIKVIHSSGPASWVRVGSAYLKDITINGKDQLGGLKREGC